MLNVLDVLDAAEVARANGSVFLCTELLQLAELLLWEVDHLSTTAGRLALADVKDRYPIDAAGATELRHAFLEGSNR